MTTPNVVPTSPAIRAVLDMVRATGKSAHPVDGRPCSDVVECVAILMGDNPVSLQAEVSAYSARTGG